MLPKFSLRLILILLTAAAGFSAVLARAVAGDAWAIAIASAVGWAAFAFFVHAMFYLAALTLSAIGKNRSHTDAKTAGETS